jgi:N-acetylglucosaminyltransferase
MAGANLVPDALVTIAVGLVAIALVCFMLRRAVFLAASLLPPRALPAGGGEHASITLVVSARNEAAGIDRTLAAIDRLEHPGDRLSVVLVDDASDDRTGEHLERWAAGRPRAAVLRLPERLGKPRAVRRGIEAAAPSELVAIVDADVRPRPDVLARLVAPFRDETVGAVAGYLAPDNATASPAARYAAVEAWVHQLVTSAAKDRLDVNPPTLGGAALYRRVALEQIGWLGSAPSGDDVRATAALTRAGWRTRFVPGAVADNAVAEGWRDYWRQHVRWARDVFETSRGEVPARARVTLARRVEMLMSSAGYADRVAFLAAVVLAASGALTPWLPASYVGLRALEVCVAVAKAGRASGIPAYLAVLPVFFTLDVAASVVATGEHLARRPRVDSAPRRAVTDA